MYAIRLAAGKLLTVLHISTGHSMLVTVVGLSEALMIMEDSIIMENVMIMELTLQTYMDRWVSRTQLQCLFKILTIYQKLVSLYMYFQQSLTCSAYSDSAVLQ